MCRATVEGGRRCPSCKGERNRAYQRARYAAQKASKPAKDTIASQAATATLTPIPVPTKDGLRDFEEVKKDAQELNQQMSYAFVSYEEEDRVRVAQELGYENLDAMYADFERRSTKVGEEIAAQAEMDAGLEELTEEDIQTAIERDNERFREQLREKFPNAQAIVDASLAIRAEGKKVGFYTARNKLMETFGIDDVEAGEMIAKSQKEQNKYYNELERKNPLPPELDKRAAVLENAYLNRLKEIREFGGSVEADYKVKKHEKSLESACQVYPSDWVKKSNDYPIAMSVKTSSGRAHYSPLSAVAETKPMMHTKGYKALDESGKIANPDADGEDYVYLEADKGYVFAQSRRSGHALRGVTATLSLTDPSGKDSPPADIPADSGMARKWEWRNYYTSDISGNLTSHEGWVAVPYTPYPVKHTGAYRAELTISMTQGGENLGQYDSVARHEMAHRFENSVPGIVEMESAFKNRREVDENGNRETLKPIRPGSREISRHDNYVDNYTGKEYNSMTNYYGKKWKAYEVLSVGMEGLFGRNYGALVGYNSNNKSDHNHRAFVLGLLATR